MGIRYKGMMRRAGSTREGQAKRSNISDETDLGNWKKEV